MKMSERSAADCSACPTASLPSALTLKSLSDTIAMQAGVELAKATALRGQAAFSTSMPAVPRVVIKRFEMGSYLR